MTLRPDKPLSVYDIMHYHRDFYGGTQYDTSVGMAAGTQLDYWDIDDFNKCDFLCFIFYGFELFFWSDHSCCFYVF